MKGNLKREKKKSIQAKRLKPVNPEVRGACTLQGTDRGGGYEQNFKRKGLNKRLTR